MQYNMHWTVITCLLVTCLLHKVKFQLAGLINNLHDINIYVKQLGEEWLYILYTQHVQPLSNGDHTVQYLIMYVKLTYTTGLINY
jgi:hypothetical protein